MRKLAIFSAAFSVAAVLYIYLLHDVRAIWLAGACLVLSVLGRSLQIHRLSIVCLGLAVGIVWCALYHTTRILPLDAMTGENQTMTLQVTELPRQTQYGAAVEGETGKCGVILYGTEELLQAMPGDRITATGTVERTAIFVKDDESLYYRSKGLDLRMISGSTPLLQKGTPTLPQRIRIWLQSRLSELYEGNAQALLRALITGDQSGLTYAQRNTLSVAGLRHAIAVSGMHVSMLLLVIGILCGRSPRLTAVVGIPVTVLFAWMTGASASVCRAAAMQIMVLSAPLVRREQDSFTTLGVAALLLLLQNPWAVAGVSFQLSFAAVAGLFVCSGPIQTYVLSRKKKPGRLLRFAAGTLSATLGATIFSLPLTLYYFRLVSIAAPITNFLTLWAVTGMFVLGLLSCCLGPVGNFLTWIVTVLADYVLTVCDWIAAWPFAAAYPQNPPLLIWSICGYGLLLSLPFWKKEKLRIWLASAMTAAFLVCTLGANRQYTGNPWRITALDVGQGQCILLQIGEFSAAIDCGGSYPEEAGEQLARTLHSAGVTKLDALIVSHYDSDHAGGVPQLLERIDVHSLFLPVTEAPPDWVDAQQETDSQVIYLEAMTEITVPDGIIRLYPSLWGENDNNQSVCVLATAEEYDILITGDLDRFAEMRMLSHWNWPDVDLLVAGHHGAADSTGQVLLDDVQPETVLISVSADNPYGHPSEETLQRIQQTGAEILRTDQLGTIQITP